MEGLLMSRLISMILLALACCPSFALDRPGTIFKIFQFPPNMIPRIDGDPDDWKIVPDDYSIGMDQLVDDTNKDHKPDPKDLDVRVKVGWVKGWGMGAVIGVVGVVMGTFSVSVTQ